MTSVEAEADGRHGTRRSLRNSIVLAGSGRSGTTWVGNVIAANPMVAIIFEPFDRRRVAEVAALPLRAYARPMGRYPEWEPVVERVLRGAVQNEWTQRQGRRWWANKRLIKTIRATLMLGWLTERFQPRIVYITRHPCAVVLSRLKLKWETHLDVFLGQTELVEDYLAPFIDLIEGAETSIARHALMWAVENFVPLQQEQRKEWVWCTYEELYTQPEAEADRILRELGMRKNWLTKRALNRISMVTRADSALTEQRDALTEWQRQLSSEEIRIILDLVAAFGIDIYGSDIMPLTLPKRVSP